MKIEHIAIWTKQLERLKTFYEKYFNAKSNDLYTNKEKRFKSYFLTFDSGARLELMQRPDVTDLDRSGGKEYDGYAHLAVSVGSKQKVDDLTKRLSADGYKIVDGPRTTGDGYYESVILDPDGNRIEITV
jgi:lactoylglutathione lyase